MSFCEKNDLSVLDNPRPYFSKSAPRASSLQKLEIRRVALPSRSQGKGVKGRERTISWDEQEDIYGVSS